MRFNYTMDMEVQTLPTGRTYFTKDGPLPSLTTILGKTSPNKIFIDAWKARVGEEEAARVSKAATDRGTLIHSYAEDYFNNKDLPEILDPTIAHMTKELIKATKSGLEEVWGQEQVLWSLKYGFAGRTDMVGIWKGKPTIIDFKTSKKKKGEKEIRDYFVQGCGYGEAHNELFNTTISDMVIIITNEKYPAQIYEKKTTPFKYELFARCKEYQRL